MKVGIQLKVQGECQRQPLASPPVPHTPHTRGAALPLHLPAPVGQRPSRKGAGGGTGGPRDGVPAPPGRTHVIEEGAGVDGNAEALGLRAVCPQAVQHVRHGAHDAHQHLPAALEEAVEEGRQLSTEQASLQEAGAGGPCEPGLAPSAALSQTPIHAWAATLYPPNSISPWLCCPGRHAPSPGLSPGSCGQTGQGSSL